MPSPRSIEWRKQGKGIFIYSSGSIEAQKLYFAHSTVGNLERLYRRYFDTTTGPKTMDAASYTKIATANRIGSRRQILVSDRSYPPKSSPQGPPPSTFAASTANSRQISSARTRLARVLGSFESLL